MSKDKSSLKEIAKIIKGANNIALFGHISPDIDCFGSLFGLYQGLVALGKKAQIYSHESLRFDQATLFDESLVKLGGFNPNEYDLLIAVDTATKDRLGEYKEAFTTHPNTVKIDHHRVGSCYAEYDYVDFTKSSCSEIIYTLLTILKVNITPEIATALYAGLSADTGSFIYSNVNDNSFETGKLLFERKADIRKINRTLYQSLTRVQLEMKKHMYRNMEIIDDQVALIVVTNDDLVKAGACKQDCENHSAELMAINGINVSCAIIERVPNEFCCSFRGKDDYNVSVIAQRLGGGGHVSAAGCRFICESAEKAKAQVLDAIRKYLKSREA